MTAFESIPVSAALCDRIQQMLDEPDVRDLPAMLSATEDLEADLEAELAKLRYIKQLGYLLHEEGISTAAMIDAQLATELHPIIEDLAAVVARVRGVEQ